MTSKPPLSQRPGLVELPPRNPITRSLSALRKQHRLAGCVLITFDGEIVRVGTTYSSETDAFGRALAELADRVLVMLDDGTLNPSGVAR